LIKGIGQDRHRCGNDEKGRQGYRVSEEEPAPLYALVGIQRGSRCEKRHSLPV
jgi:hypothetical protein